VPGLRELVTISVGVIAARLGLVGTSPGRHGRTASLVKSWKVGPAAAVERWSAAAREIAGTKTRPVTARLTTTHKLRALSVAEPVTATTSAFYHMP